MRYIILKPYKIMHYKTTHFLDWNCHTTSATTPQRSNLRNNTTIGVFPYFFIFFSS